MAAHGGGSAHAYAPEYWFAPAPARGTATADIDTPSPSYDKQLRRPGTMGHALELSLRSK